MTRNPAWRHREVLVFEQSDQALEDVDPTDDQHQHAGESDPAGHTSRVHAHPERRGCRLSHPVAEPSSPIDRVPSPISRDFLQSRIRL